VRTITHQRGGGSPTVLEDVSRVTLQRPNFIRLNDDLRIREAGSKDWRRVPGFRREVSDGQRVWSAYSADKEYRTGSVGTNGEGISLKTEVLLGAFFDREATVTRKIEALRKEDLLRSVSLLGRATWMGIPYQVVRVIYNEARSPESVTEDHYVGSDGLVRRLVVLWSGGGRRTTFDLEGLRVNPRIRRATFAIAPPAGYHAITEEPVLQTVLSVGTPAPNFTLPGRNGESISLFQFRGKVVVLDFWATWCGPCMQALPEVNRLARTYRRRGVVVLAIDVGDTKNAFKQWLSQNSALDSLIYLFDADSMRGGGIDARLYKVDALPTTFVIGRDGKIAASFVGEDGNTARRVEDAVRAALDPPED